MPFLVHVAFIHVNVDVPIVTTDQLQLTELSGRTVEVLHLDQQRWSKYT